MLIFFATLKIFIKLDIVKQSAEPFLRVSFSIVCVMRDGHWSVIKRIDDIGESSDAAVGQGRGGEGVSRVAWERSFYLSCWPPDVYRFRVPSRVNSPRAISWSTTRCIFFLSPNISQASSSRDFFRRTVGKRAPRKIVGKHNCKPGKSAGNFNIVLDPRRETLYDFSQLIIVENVKCVK